MKTNKNMRITIIKEEEGERKEGPNVKTIEEIIVVIHHC